MITDEQGRQWFLQKLYDAGARYLVRDFFRGPLYAYAEKPFKKNGMEWLMKDESDFYPIAHIRFDVPGVMFDDIKWADEEPFDIAKALGLDVEDYMF